MFGITSRSILDLEEDLIHKYSTDIQTFKLEKENHARHARQRTLRVQIIASSAEHLLQTKSLCECQNLINHLDIRITATTSAGLFRSGFTRLPC